MLGATLETVVLHAVPFFFLLESQQAVSNHDPQKVGGCVKFKEKQQNNLQILFDVQLNALQTQDI